MRLSINILAVLVFIVVSCKLYSQTYIEGKVMDMNNYHILSNANILIKSINKGCNTDSLGNYKLNSIPEGWGVKYVLVLKIHPPPKL